MGTGAPVTTFMFCDAQGRPLTSFPSPNSPTPLKICGASLPPPGNPSSTFEWTTLLNAVPALLIMVAVLVAVVGDFLRRRRRREAPELY